MHTCSFKVLPDIHIFRCLGPHRCVNGMEKTTVSTLDVPFIASPTKILYFENVYFLNGKKANRQRTPHFL